MRKIDAMKVPHGYGMMVRGDNYTKKVENKRRKTNIKVQN
jgi:hypothetical protein